MLGSLKRTNEALLISISFQLHNSFSGGNSQKQLLPPQRKRRARLRNSLHRLRRVPLNHSSAPGEPGLGSDHLGKDIPPTLHRLDVILDRVSRPHTSRAGVVAVGPFHVAVGDGVDAGVVGHAVEREGFDGADVTDRSGVGG